MIKALVMFAEYYPAEWESAPYEAHNLEFQ